MKPTPGVLLLGFGTACVALEVGTVALRLDLGRGFQLGDALTLFLAPVVIPGLASVIWWYSRPAGPASRPERDMALALILVGAIWYATGVGLNIGTNAIARQFDDPTSRVAQLTDLFDERIGHLLWHGGELALAFGLAVVARTAGRGAAATPENGPATLGGLLFGFTWFAEGVEGQTVAMMLPAAALMLAFLRPWRWRTGPAAPGPIAVFLVVAATVALVLFLIWGGWHGGFPEFSELGWV